MTHWFLSITPWKTLGIYSISVAVAYFWLGVPALGVGIYVGGVLSVFYYGITISNCSDRLKGIAREIVIQEFIDKRPFREADYLKKEEILQEILNNVNKKVYHRMGINYGYDTTGYLLFAYGSYIAEFEKKYLQHYDNIDVEDIQGWDKIMLVAKNIQDEDQNSIYKNTISSELINTYGSKKPVIVSAETDDLLSNKNSKKEQ
ncbi:uncharacterized protein AC631_04206 [Debaryomyces fabryi]|uniref:Uncharacterized protein n=1 Tax=Debaryomyces fabryi TaxID=58627 RepID=A0A0V1PUV3_9ASCO|nr:uncharacterized protein AC631_04206 [Debaryomyces fabryi]KSA00052.1 hypothetical protein AC631_04206 [Debaryomyces fabryi]CUM57600.1 unnamed protein product [Debaryomyces fabryi]